MLDRILSRRAYVLVDAALLLLALASIGLAQVDLRGWNTVVALVIAAAKAAVIALFFMELKFASGLHRLVGVAAILWLGILMVGTLDDLLTRGWLPIPGK
jgi:cytochrome c oxidase subunit 4